MEQRITGREIVIFIAMFNLWNAYFECGYTIDGGGLELRAPGWGCDECSFTLHNNGMYEIEAWIPKMDENGNVDENQEDGEWETVHSGDIFKEAVGA